MTRISFAVSVLLLTLVSSVLHAEDRQESLLDLEFKEQELHSADTELSLQEYQRISRRNQRYLRRTLEAYSKEALQQVGIPDRAVNFMGAALGVATRGVKLNLNESKTLALEIKDVETQEPKVYFGINLKW